MIHHICSVLDQAAQVFGRPMFVARIEVARRAFVDEVNRAAPDNQLHAHPEDFALYAVGQFDDEAGRLFPLDAPVLVARAKEVLT